MPNDKIKVLYVKKDDEGNASIKSKNFDRLCSKGEVKQLTDNIAVLATPEQAKRFTDRSPVSAYGMVKAGKSLSPTEAFNGVDVFGINIFESVNSVKKEYELKLSKGTHGEDLVSKACQPPKSRKASKVEETVLSSLSTDEQALASKIFALMKDVKKKASKKATPVSETEETAAELDI